MEQQQLSGRLELNLESAEPRARPGRQSSCRALKGRSRHGGRAAWDAAQGGGGEEDEGGGGGEAEEKQLVLEEQMGKGEDRDMTATLTAFPEYRIILLETQVA